MYERRMTRNCSGRGLGALSRACLLLLFLGLGSPSEAFIVFSHKVDGQRPPTCIRSQAADQVARIRQCTNTTEVSMALVNASDDSSSAVAAAVLRTAQLSSREIVPDNAARLIWGLVDRLESLVNEGDSSFTMGALVDTLSALAILKRKMDFRQLPDLDQNGAGRMLVLATTLVERIGPDQEEAMQGLNPSRMVDVLYALHVLGFDQTHGRCLAPEKIRLFLCRQLTKSHALSLLSAGDMSILLTTLAAKAQPFHSDESTLAVALMRRFRKQAVRQSATLKQLLQALQSVTTIAAGANLKEDGSVMLFQEAQIMVFTVFKSILQRNAATDKLDNRKIKAGNFIGLPQISRMLECISSMDVLTKTIGESNLDSSKGLQSLWASFLSDTSQEAFRDASVEEMAQFLRAVEADQSSNLALGLQHGMEMGVHFQEKIRLGLKEEVANPQSVNSILRFVALHWGNNETVLGPFLDCAQLLFINESFLASCTGAELTNFLTFLEKTRFQIARDNSMENALIAIGRRILDVADSISPMSPSQASRILSSYTAIVAERSRHGAVGPSQALMESTRSLFQSVGGHLLTDKPEELSPRDISDSLCAYAKASYVEDMGIFDHLTSLLSARVEDCTIRQVTQSLWACGKMAIWESKQRQRQSDDLDDQNTAADHVLEPPPYLPSASHFALFLSQHVDEMTSKDVAQTVWALARLQSVQSPSVEPTVAINHFLSRAIALAPQLTSQEVANILWGMSFAGYKDCRPIIQPFTDRILHRHRILAEQSTPQDAASLMIALGRMNIQDEKVFKVLSNDMMAQLDVANAESIANALWAHRAVQITPPRQLLDQWATKRLGLVAVQPPHQV